MNDTRRTLPLIRAAAQGDLSSVLGLIDTPGMRHEMALVAAARTGHPPVLEVLLPYCQDTSHPVSALCDAAEHGRAACVRFLLDQGVAPTALNSTPLQEALKNRHAECIALLAPVSDCEAVLVAMLERHQPQVDDLAPHLTLDLLRLAARRAPANLDLPVIRATLRAHETATALDASTQPAPPRTTAPRL